MKSRKFLAVLVGIMMLSAVMAPVFALAADIGDDAEGYCDPGNMPEDGNDAACPQCGDSECDGSCGDAGQGDSGQGNSDLYIVQYTYAPYKNLGLAPRLNGGGEFFRMNVYNTVTEEKYQTFCANGGCKHFAGASDNPDSSYNKADGCDGYVIGKHASQEVYNQLVAALNYIEDNTPGGLLNEFNRPIAQTTVWSILGFVSSEEIMNRDERSLTQAEKTVILAALNAAKDGYNGNGTVIDFLYLVCEKHGATYENCQPQIVPIMKYVITNDPWTAEEPGDGDEPGNEPSEEPGEQPGDPGDGEEPGDPDDGDEPDDPDDGEEPGDPDDGEEPGDPDDGDEPDDQHDIVKPEDPEDGDEYDGSGEPDDGDEPDGDAAEVEEVAGFEEIAENATPLAEFPEEVSLEETDMPLSEMPQTGDSSDIGLLLAGLGLSLTAAGGALATAIRARKEEE